MARLCPQCGEIHFETTTSPLPSHCRKCEADLNEASGLMPRLQLEEQEQPPADGTTPPPRPKPKKAKGPLPDGMKRIIAGGVVIAAAGVMLYLGYDWHTRVKQATATVAEGESGAPAAARRNRQYATYTVGPKTYYQYPGIRQTGEAFPVYYLPEDPATGYEQKPFLWIVIGGKVLMIGLGVLGFGLMKFMVARARAADFQRTMARAG
jgi:hypothetical protein